MANKNNIKGNKMKYTAILSKDGSAYLVGTPEYLSEKPLCLQDKVILEQNDKINQLEADKLEAYKIILGLERQNFNNNDVDNLIRIANKANKYIKEVEK